jgi:hypothetical protein
MSEELQNDAPMEAFQDVMSGDGAAPMMEVFQTGADAFQGAVGGEGGLAAGGDAMMDSIGTALEGGAVPGMTPEMMDGVMDTFMDNMDMGNLPEGADFGDIGSMMMNSVAEMLPEGVEMPAGMADMVDGMVTGMNDAGITMDDFSDAMSDYASMDGEGQEGGPDMAEGQEVGPDMAEGQEGGPDIPGVQEVGPDIPGVEFVPPDMDGGPDIAGGPDFAGGQEEGGFDIGASLNQFEGGGEAAGGLDVGAGEPVGGGDGSAIASALGGGEAAGGDQPFAPGSAGADSGADLALGGALDAAATQAGDGTAAAATTAAEVAADTAAGSDVVEESENDTTPDEVDTGIG